MNKFINQVKIIAQLGYLQKEIEKGANFNILLRAPSGYGKTTLALKFLEGKDYIMYPPGEERYFFINKRFHFFDEAHTLKNFEFLYRFMDSKKYTIILATNLSGSLPEPVINRCINLIFEEYSPYHIKEILKSSLEITLKEELIDFLSYQCRNNPRVAKMIAFRLSIICSYEGIPQTTGELERCLNRIGIYRYGLNELDLRYLEFLQEVKISSLERLQRGTGLDRDTIINEIEPYLVKMGFIRISSRGREFTEKILI
jgi:hypothetical protein